MDPYGWFTPSYSEIYAVWAIFMVTEFAATLSGNASFYSNNAAYSRWSSFLDIDCDIIGWSGEAYACDVVRVGGQSLSLGEALTQFFTNTTLSLLTYPAIARDTDVDAMVIGTQPEYFYDPFILWEVYGAALAVSSVCVVIGLLTLWDNGLPGSLTFSQILLATRSKRLDTVALGAASPSPVHLPRSAWKTRLRFEHIDDGPHERQSLGFKINDN